MTDRDKPIHVDLAEFERAMRETLAEPLPAGADEMMKAQARGREADIQFALWFLGEIERGTNPDMLIEATGTVIGNMVRNVDDALHGEHGEKAGEAVLAEVADFLAREGDPDDRPTVTLTTNIRFTEGGNA